ncbi:MAG: magnesium transporter [Mycoplasmoidaceae bacterium]
MNKYEKEVITLSKLIVQAYNIKNSRNLKRIIKNKPINLLVDSIEHINDYEVLKYFLFCSINIRLGEIFISLSYENKVKVINSDSNKLIKDIFNDIEIDDIYELINELPKPEFKKVIVAISSTVRKKLISLSTYDEGEVGSIMNTSQVKLNGELTISKAVKIIEEKKDEIELNGMIYIIDDQEKLIGQIHIYDILLEKKRSLKLKKMMNKNFVTIQNNDDIEDLIVLFQKYELRMIPVVNKEEVLVGFVNDSDIISLVNEEATEDIYKMYGINELDKPYVRTRVLDIVKSRVVWLILLMIVSSFTSMALEGLQDWGGSIISSGLSTFVLVPIIPVISGTSGNAGSQAAATIIRSLSIGEIKTKDYRKVFYKEFLVSLVIGLSLAAVNFVRLIIYYQIFPIHFTNAGGENILTNYSVDVATLIICAGISCALFLAILLSKFVGSFLPLLAMKIKIDPAAMASPLLTTIIDTLTVSILFLIGTGIIYSILN